MLIPNGWSGSQSLIDNGSTLYVSLSPVSHFSELGATSFAHITLIAGKTLALQNLREKENPLRENCKVLSLSKEVIDEKAFLVTHQICPTIEYKILNVKGPRVMANLTYSALPSAFESNLGNFNRSADTLQVR